MFGMFQDFVFPAQALVRSFILFHDCIHDSVFTDKRWNYWAGKFASAAVLCDHETWRRGHLQHHAVVGKPVRPSLRQKARPLSFFWVWGVLSGVRVGVPGGEIMTGW
jgi:fatty acid desaturase